MTGWIIALVLALIGALGVIFKRSGGSDGKELTKAVKRLKDRITSEKSDLDAAVTRADADAKRKEKDIEAKAANPDADRDAEWIRRRYEGGGSD